MIHIQYFGHLTSELGIHEETLTWNNGSNAEDLLNILRARDKRWQQALAPDKIFKVVINRQISLQPNPAIPDGAEVGILPPVTGG